MLGSLAVRVQRDMLSESTWNLDQAELEGELEWMLRFSAPRSFVRRIESRRKYNRPEDNAWGVRPGADYLLPAIDAPEVRKGFAGLVPAARGAQRRVLKSLFRSCLVE